jgi:hypothetical protein
MSKPDKEIAMPNEQRRDRQLRPEARPLDWKSLDPEQRNAFREIVAWLNTAVSDLQSRNAREGGDHESWLDLERSSRILMLSGERGSGKTTALLSVIQACLRFQRQKGTVPPQEDYPSDLLAHVSSRLIWLEPVDMEPLPKSVNLLAGILSRIEATVKQKNESSGPPGRSERQSGADSSWWGDGRDPLLALMRLQTDVALAWEGNLVARGGQLDPDVYATEVMRAERARLMLNRRISDLLDDLAEKHFRSRELLFVLPIDDCDLSPALAVPILRVLRMISAPRLFTIVLGDEPMARTVFRLKYQGELIEAAAPTGTTGADTWGYRLGGTADQVGLNALRKLLPPGQRIYLRPMRAKTALDYAARAEQPSIRQMLADFQLRSLWTDEVAHDAFLNSLPLPSEQYTRIDTLVHIIDAERPVFRYKGDPEPEDTTQRRQGSYSGRAFFRQPARRVLDLWARLYDIHTSELSEEEKGGVFHVDRTLPAKKLRLLLNYLAEQARQAIEEDFELLDDERLRLTRMIDRNWEGDYELDSNYLQLLPPPWDAVPTRSSVQLDDVVDVVRNETQSGEAAGFTAYTNCQQVKDWFLETRMLSPEGKLDVREVRASRPLRAALTLFSDHVAMHDRERLSRGSIRPNPFQLRCAATRWIAHDGSLSHEVHWPAPDWESLWPYDLLTSSWSAAVRRVTPRGAGEESSDEKDQLEFFAFVWILTCTSLIARVLPRQVPGEIPPSRENWRKLGKSVALLVPLAEGGRTHRHIRSWLLNLAGLLAPECGLPQAILKEHFQGLFSFWEQHAYEVRSSRARVMRLDELERSPDKRSAQELARLFGARDTPTFVALPNHPINRAGEGILRPRLFEEREGK